MTDRIDAFDPFEPLTADEAEPGTSGAEGSARPSSSVGPSDRGAASGSKSPSGSGRRWSLPASVPAPRPTSAPAPEVPVRHTDTDIAALREIALPELRSALARLAERGHEILLDDCLDEEEEALAVRFRPDRGPLAAHTSTGDKPARFELRLGFERDADGAPDRVLVIALEVSVPLDGSSSVLGRTALRTLTPEWVAHRFVAFVAHALERS